MSILSYGQWKEQTYEQWREEIAKEQKDRRYKMSLYGHDFDDMNVWEFARWQAERAKEDAERLERAREAELRELEAEQKRKELYQQRLPLYQQWVKLIQAGKFDELSDKEIAELVRELSPTENHRIVFSLPPELRKRFIERKIAIGGGRK